MFTVTSLPWILLLATSREKLIESLALSRKAIDSKEFMQLKRSLNLSVVAWPAGVEYASRCFATIVEQSSIGKLYEQTSIVCTNDADDCNLRGFFGVSIERHLPIAAKADSGPS